jgi:protein-tyrosine-phosphatase
VPESDGRSDGTAPGTAAHPGLQRGRETQRDPGPVIQAMQELGISMSGQRSKSISDVPMQDIDLVVSFGDADTRCDPLPGKAKIARWPITIVAADPDLPALRARRDEIDKRVFALFLDHWRNTPRPA